jgi:hypothetical protein
VKDENGDLLADSHNILNRWKNYFSQLLNVRRVSSGFFQGIILVIYCMVIPSRTVTSIHDLHNAQFPELNLF